MRLIDADELKLDLKWLEVDTPVYHDVMSTIDDAPTVDAIEVVRCKDCTSFYSGWCCDFGIHRDDNEFCSGGERREDGKAD